jgi:hypothetical protein
LPARATFEPCARQKAGRSKSLPNALGFRVGRLQPLRPVKRGRPCVPSIDSPRLLECLPGFCSWLPLGGINDGAGRGLELGAGLGDSPFPAYPFREFRSSGSRRVASRRVALSSRGRTGEGSSTGARWDDSPWREATRLRYERLPTRARLLGAKAPSLTTSSQGATPRAPATCSTVRRDGLLVPASMD